MSLTPTGGVAPGYHLVPLQGVESFVAVRLTTDN